jgi:hypothetical protein
MASNENLSDNDSKYWLENLEKNRVLCVNKNKRKCADYYKKKKDYKNSKI